MIAIWEKSNMSITPKLVLYRKNELQPMVKIRMLRGDPTTYKWLLDNIVPLIVGVKYFKSECRKVLPTKWLTTSSEAFAVLCVENYYQHVQDTASNRSIIRKPKWTSEGLRAKRNQGWKQEGIAVFEGYCKKITEDRADKENEKVDINYKLSKMGEISKEDERKRKRDESRMQHEDGWSAAYVDEWSDNEKDQNKMIENRSAEDHENESDQDSDDNEEGEVNYT
jgi:hypothetical protein